MAEEKGAAVVVWQARVTFKGRALTIHKQVEYVGADFLGTNDGVPCWMIQPNNLSFIALLLGRKINAEIKGKSISRTRTWQYLLDARNASQANILTASGPVDQEKLEALYSDEAPNVKASKLKARDGAKARGEGGHKTIIPVEIGGKIMRCVAPVGSRDVLSVAIDAGSLSAALEFLSMGIQAELDDDPDVLTPRSYCKRKHGDEDGEEGASVEGDETDGAEITDAAGNEPAAGSASVDIGDVD
jgi:hypothetical protein